MMDKQMNCDFIFGTDNSSVKRMDTSILSDSIDVPNRYFGKTNWYYQPKVISLTGKYDVIINDLGIFCITAWLLLVLSKVRNQKIYNWDHGWYGRETLAKKFLKRIYFGLADGSFIYGDYAIRLMKQNGFNGDKLFAIHNSLDYNKQVEIREKISSSGIYEKHFGNSNPVLLMIGRLNLRKKIGLLLEAIAGLKEKGEAYNVVLIGDGEDRKTLEMQSNKLHLDEQIWFFGPCYDEAKNAELIYNADMCVVPGDIGLTAIHAMTFGIPVVSHNYYPNQGPEFEAIKEGITGAFFEHNNVKSLAKTISAWFRMHKNDREEIREACYKEIADNWTPEYQINILKQVINA